MKHYKTEYHEQIFRIEEDYPDVGAYLYVFEKEKDKYDYLQNSVKDCIEFAFEEFGVPIDSWDEIIGE